MIITCTRRIQFCAGHRVMGHENKCAHLHGHNYVVFLTAQMDDRGQDEQTDKVGRVIDFSVLKYKVGEWIMKNWDHGMILYLDDRASWAAIKAFNIDSHSQQGEGVTQKIFSLGLNPTAENLAHFLLRTVCPSVLQGLGVTVTEITLWETENCYATVKL